MYFNVEADTEVLFLKSILLYLMFWPHIKMKK